MGRRRSGKTTIANVAGLRVSDLYSDGELYLDLRGAEGVSLNPRDGLTSLLSFLGVEQLPERLDELRSVYLSAIASRRAVIVIDNPHDKADASWFLPNRSTISAVILVSRSGAVADQLDPDRKFHVDRLFDAEALELLETVSGRRLEEADPAVHRILRRCDGLPFPLASDRGSPALPTYRP